MNARIALIVLLCLSALQGQSQVINQDATGKSSILAPGATIGVDVQAASIKANYYSITDKKYGPIIGFDLQGKSETGLADLFSKGNFVPSGRLSGLIGWQTSGIHNNAGLIETKVVEVTDGTKAEARYRELVKAAMDALGKSCPSDTAKYGKLLRYFVGLPHKDGNTPIPNPGWKFIGSLNLVLPEKDAPQPSNLTDCEKQTRTTIAGLQQAVNADETIQSYLVLDSQTRSINEKLKAQAVYIGKAYSTKTYFYLRGGVNATGFTYDRTASYPTMVARFRDTSTVLPFVELGASGRISGRHFWGGTFGWERISSFSLLDKSTYKYTPSPIALTGGSLSSSKDIVAYSGDFNKSWRFYLNADYIWLKPLDYPHYLALNPYTRLNFQDDRHNFKTAFVLGLGAYFLDGKSGKFLGGVYLQSNDISGNTESNLSKSLTFGLIAKLSFSSMFGLGGN